MLNLNDLNITHNWRVRKIGFLSQIDSLPGNLFIGCGVSDEAGVLDAQDTPYKSTAELLFNRKELAFNHLLRGLNENYQSGLKLQIQELELTICIKNINWDALCCYVLCDHLVRTADFPNWARELVESANAVNQGEALWDDTGSAPFALFYALTNKIHGIDLKTVFSKGQALVEDIVQIREREDRRSTNMFLSPILDKQRYSELIASNEQDYDHFINDYHSGHTFEMQLPCSEDGQNMDSKTARVLFLEHVPQSRLFIYWGRQELDLLVYLKEDEGTGCSNWSFTIHPQSGFSLKGLGYYFEKYEASIRKDRKGIPRWNDRNYSNNEDPWYDGRNHQYCLVESPRSGTKIRSCDTIKQMLLSNWHSTQIGGGNDVSQPVHLTYFFFAVRNQVLDQFSGWRNKLRFLRLDAASKILKQASFKHYKSAATGCIFYTTEVNNNVLIEVTPKIDTRSIGMEGIPDMIKLAEEKALEQLKSALKEFPDLYYREPEKEVVPDFLHLSITSPDLGVQSVAKLNEVFDEFCSCKITSNILQTLKDGKSDLDLLDLSTCISFLFDKENKEFKNPRNTKKLFILYSLFIKSSYQQFSQKLKPIPNFNKEGEALDAVLNVQEEFSRFLTSYDFVATELSRDPKMVNFAEEVYSAIHLKEQKDETNQEMDFLSHLANTYANESLKKRHKRVQHFIVGFAALAVCDFLYAFFSDYLEVWGITEDTHNRWQPRLLFTISSAFLFYCLYFLYNYLEDRKRG